MAENLIRKKVVLVSWCLQIQGVFFVRKWVKIGSYPVTLEVRHKVIMGYF